MICKIVNTFLHTNVIVGPHYNQYLARQLPNSSRVPGAVGKYLDFLLLKSVKYFSKILFILFLSIPHLGLYTFAVLWGWSGGAKVLCILPHWGVQLILAYSWARPAILVVGKGRGGMFLFLLFLHFHSCSSFFPVPLFHLLYSLLSLFSLSLGDDTKWPSRVDVSLNPNTFNFAVL